MRSSRIAIALVLLSFASAPSLTAQGSAADIQVPESATDFGNLVTPELVVDAFGLRTEAEETKAITFFFTPSATDVDGAPIAGLMFGGSYKKIQMDLRYQNIGSADGSTNFDQFRLRGKYSFMKPESRLGVAIVGQHVDTREASTTKTGLLSVSWGLTHGDTDTTKLQIYTNLGWSDKQPDQGEAVSDAVRIVGVSFRVGVVEIGLDYTFENDITKGEDDYSLTARQAIGVGKLAFGAGKDGVVFASYTVPFQRVKAQP